MSAEQVLSEVLGIPDVDDAIETLANAGYVIVPKEPTEAMLTAARDWSAQKYGKPVGNDGAVGCYRSMVAAGSRPIREDQ